MQPNRPKTSEYNEDFSQYVDLVPDGDIIAILSEQVKGTLEKLNGVSEEQAQFKYAPGKWSIKEVLGHMADTERIMAYRLLSIARGETVSLPGFDEEIYVSFANFNHQTIKDHLENLNIVRQSTLHLLKSLQDNTWLRKGTANHSDISVRALAYIIAGHELHHRQLIIDRYIGSDEYPSN